MTAASSRIAWSHLPTVRARPYGAVRGPARARFRSEALVHQQLTAASLLLWLYAVLLVATVFCFWMGYRDAVRWQRYVSERTQRGLGSQGQCAE